MNFTIGAISKALGPNRSSGNRAPINVTLRSTTASRSVIFGRVRAGGVVVYYNRQYPDTKYLHYVVAYAGHECNAVEDIWLDNVKVLDANINPSTGAVTQDPYTGKLNIWRYTGTSSQAAAAGMVAAFPAKWTSTFQLKGIAYAHLRMERNDTAWPSGAPQSVSALIEGAKLYDPRLDSTNGGSGSHRYTDATTWAYSTNPALALRWVLTGGSVTNDVATPLVKYGLKDSNTRLPDAFTMAAANICDESLTGAYTTPGGDQVRYALNLELSCGQTPREWIEDILTTMAGMRVEVNGNHRIYAGAYDAPVHTITDSDIYGDIQIQDTSSHEDRYNAVGGVFRDAANEFIEQTTKFRTDTDYETQDGGERIPKELDLAGVESDYRAQRLCEIEKRKSRLMRTIKFVGALNLLKIAPWETFSFSNTKYGWTNRVFRCIEKSVQFDEGAGRIEITARVESTAVWTDMVTADYNNPNSHTPVVATELPEEPDGLITYGQQNGVLVTWQRSPTPGVIYLLEESTSSTMSSPTVVYEGADTQAQIFKAAGTIYYYRVRAYKAGQYSPYEPASGGVSGAVASVATALSGSASGSASSSSTSASQTTNSVTVTPTGGTSPYTYAWTVLSGSGITIDSSSAATTTFSATGLASPETLSIVARCTITDNVAATKTIDVAVTISRTEGYVVVAFPDDVSLYVQADTYTSDSVTATPDGGTAPYTHAWTWFAGGAGITIDNDAADTTTFTVSGLISAGFCSGVALDTVTDNVGAIVASNYVTIQFVYSP